MRRWSLVLVTVLGVSLWSLAQCQVEIIPPSPVAGTPVSIKITGKWGDPCPRVTYSTFVIGSSIYISGQISSFSPCLPGPDGTWTVTAQVGPLGPGTYWVSVNLVDTRFGGQYTCRAQRSFVVQPYPGWPGWPPYPYPPTRPDYTPQLQAWLNRLSEYLRIAKEANARLSPAEKEALANAIMPILLQGQTHLGGEAVWTVRPYVPPGLADTLRGLAASLTDKATLALTSERVVTLAGAGVDIFKPVREVSLLPPQSHWMCYWSYVYAWWTWIFAYWSYIVHDGFLPYWTMVYAYYSLWYAYYCYLSCP